MVQTELTEILNDMRLKNEASAENLGRLLTSINTKLDIMAEENGESDLIRLYLSELKKVLEDEHKGSITKLEELRNHFAKEFATQGEYSDEKLNDIKKQLESLTEDIFTHINSVSEKISPKPLQEQIDILGSSVNSLRSLMEALSNNDVSEKLHDLQSEFSKLENGFANIMTAHDFSAFKNDFADFIKKIIENSNILHINSETAKEQIAEILAKIENVNYSQDFQNIADRIGEIRLSFENNSKMNYESILNEINNLKYEINANLNSKDNSEDLTKLNLRLDDLFTNIQFLRDLSSQQYSQIIDRISVELERILSDAHEKYDSNSEMNFGEIKTAVGNILVDINTVKSDIEKSNDGVSYALSAGFEDLKSAGENLLSAFNSLSGSFEEISSKNAGNILSSLENLAAGAEELKQEISEISSGFVGKVFDAVNEISLKIEDFSNNEALTEGFSGIKDAISILKSDWQLSHEEYLQQLRDNKEIQTNQIRSISDDINFLKTELGETSESIKNYITQLESALGANGENLSAKLLDMQVSLVQNAELYEQKLEGLKNNILEFVHIVENSNSDTEGKIVSSLEEVSALKNELSNLNQVIESSKDNFDNKFAQSVLEINNGIESIISDISNISGTVQSDINTTLRDSLLSIDEKFERLTESLAELKEEQSENDFVLDISEKFSEFKKEFDLINTDMAGALQAKTEEILEAVEPIKNRIDELAKFDFENVISELKSQIELSFMNFSVDINSEFTSNSEAVSRLEQAYKEAFNKIAAMEDLVTDKINNNIELLGINLESGIREIKTSYDGKCDDVINEITSEIVGSAGNIKEYIKDSLNDTVDKLTNVCNQDALKELIGGLKTDSSNIQSSINDINSKLDVIVSDSSEEELQMRFDEIQTSFDGLNSNFDKISENDKNVLNMISLIGAKVDAIAQDSSTFDMFEELDEVKNIIFEQRKFFEASSDEKSAAIDKYLRDVLVKLDSVDLEKNAEDIKETILNALLSLTDQISFVEETEEIKDFVEERTDAIHKSLTEVQNQLRQLTSDDDFDYKYTLQDVESDIAKLRMAINNLPSGDFAEISEEIKQLITSFENLDTSLNSEQLTGLKSDVEKLNEDIVSISARTNKLILNSDESVKILNEGLENFSKLISKLEDRITYLDYTETNSRIEKKIDSIKSLALTSANSDKVFHQAMMYLGEWVDATTEDISSISEKVSPINQISEDVSLMSKDISQISEIHDNIKEIKEIIPDNSEVVRILEDKLARQLASQEERIEALENKTDKILSILSEKDDIVFTRKLDKIEKMLSSLSANIEKLTSYVE